MKKINILLLILLSTTFSMFGNVDKGIIDLRDYNFDSGNAVDLSGMWILKQPDKSDIYSEVPGGWEGNRGEVTYVLNILSRGAKQLIIAPSLINSEYTLLHNSIEVGRDIQNRPLYIPIELVDGDNRLEINVINKTNNLGGIMNRPFIGGYNIMVKRYERSILKDLFICGASAIMFFYFLVLFLNYKKDRYTLYLALLCLNFATRCLFINDKIIFHYITDLPYLVSNRIQYITLFLIPLLLIKFLYGYIAKAKRDRAMTTLTVVATLYPVAVAILPISIYMKLVMPFYIFVLIASLHTIFRLIQCSLKRYINSSRMLICILLLMLAGAWDLYAVVYGTTDLYILQDFILLFIVYIALLVSKREIHHINKIEELSKKSLKINKYLNKFVPKHFVKTVGIGNILDIKRGDGVEKDMIVLFASLKDFEQDLKLYNPKESVELLNRSFSIISPIISRNSGFIDKFIDETLMAVFPGKPEDAIDAIDAIIEIKLELAKYNTANIKERPIEIRSGIHAGRQFIGIVGDEKRVDATVISKVVNTASRINSFAQKIDRDILISNDVYKRLSDENSYDTKYMGRVKLKGHQNFIGIHSIYITEVEEADEIFSETMEKLEVNNLHNIEDVLQNINNRYEHHQPTQFYLNLIKENQMLEDLDK